MPTPRTAVYASTDQPAIVDEMKVRCEVLGLFCACVAAQRAFRVPVQGAYTNCNGDFGSVALSLKKSRSSDATAASQLRSASRRRPGKLSNSNPEQSPRTLSKRNPEQPLTHTPRTSTCARDALVSACGGRKQKQYTHFFVVVFCDPRLKNATKPLFL